MDEALKTAQAAGIAEADPSGDLEGFDAAVKLVAMAIAFELGGERAAAPSARPSARSPHHTPPGGVAPRLTLQDVSIGGITHVTTEMAMAAKARGHKLRLVACAEAVSADSSDDAQPAADAGHYPSGCLVTHADGYELHLANPPNKTG